MDNYNLTHKTYNAIAQTYEDKFMDLKIYDASYDLFLENLKGNSEVLEIACGPGNISRYLLNARPDLKLLGTDIAENMISRAQKNVPEAEFMLLDGRTISDLDKKFEGIICGFGIPYFSKDDCVKFLIDCSSLLTDKGIFYLSFVEGDYSTSHLKTSSDGKFSVFFHFYEKQFLADELKKSGISIVHELQVPFGKEDVHTILVGKKG